MERGEMVCVCEYGGMRRKFGGWGREKVKKELKKEVF